MIEHDRPIILVFLYQMWLQDSSWVVLIAAWNTGLV